MIDRIFKPALLLILLVFLYVAWLMKDNGRYVYHPETDHGLSQLIVDSRTGTIFFLATSDGGIGTLEFHPQTGKRVAHKPVR